MSKKKNIFLWVISLVIMMSIYTYQKRTGPTYPIRGEIELNDQEYDYELLRTHGGRGDAEVILPFPKETIVKYEYRRFKSYDSLTTKILKYDEAKKAFIAYIPHQPPAGKVQYKVSIQTDSDSKSLHEDDEWVLIRFKGGVPAFIIYPHIFFMFFGMWISVRSGAEALSKGKHTYKLAVISVIFFFCGAFILGPFVQKYAFGEFWTGWPWGTDLTDNKVAVSLLFWIIALIVSKYKPKLMEKFVFAAVCVQFLVFIIPHSMFGSEIDFRKIEDSKNVKIDQKLLERSNARSKQELLEQKVQDTNEIKQTDSTE